MGIKWDVLVNLSTTTHIASKPCGVRGKPVTKSILICSHFHSEIYNGIYNPAGFIYSTYTCWHTWHCCTNSV